MPRNIRRRKVSGSALLITVVISLVIGLICVMLILTLYNVLHAHSDLRIGNKLDRDLQSAIDLALTDAPSPGEGLVKKIDLFGTGNDSAQIQQELWGCYDLASIQVKDGPRHKEKSFFYSAGVPSYMDGCLYLAEHKRSLFLTGKTILNGKVYLPGSGIKPGYIDQRGFEESELMTGLRENSESSLPSPDMSILRYYTGMIDNGARGGGSGYIQDSLYLSFADNLQIMRYKGKLLLTDQKLSGHLILISDSLIEIGGEAQLNNILLIAPAIRFDRNFTGKVQAFATDSILLDSNCNLRYPSSLAVVKREGDGGQPRLIISRNCLLEGMVLTWSKDNKFRTYMEVGMGSVVRGIIYSGGYLFLKGQVEGCVLTDFFLFRNGASAYENYLVDARLDRSLLPAGFLGPVIFREGNKNNIVQWVD